MKGSTTIRMSAALLVVVAAAFGAQSSAHAAAPAASSAQAARQQARMRVIAALSSLDSEVPAATLRALAGDDAASLLAGIVVDRGVAGRVRLRAAASLHTLADVVALRESLRLVRASALEPRLRWHVGYGAIVLGGRIDVAAALALAADWLASPDALLRDAAVRALGHVPGAEATALLRRAGQDVDPEVRAAARLSLARR